MSGFLKSCQCDTQQNKDLNLLAAGKPLTKLGSSRRLHQVIGLLLIFDRYLMHGSLFWSLPK
jgi:hypothetical protein